MQSEYVKLCASLGLDQEPTTVSRLMDVADRSAVRWACGHSRVPGAVLRFLRLMKALGLDKDEVFKIVETKAEQREWFRERAEEAQREKQRSRDRSGHVKRPREVAA